MMQTSASMTCIWSRELTLRMLDRRFELDDSEEGGGEEESKSTSNSDPLCVCLTDVKTRANQTRPQISEER